MPNITYRSCDEQSRWALGIIEEALPVLGLEKFPERLEDVVLSGKDSRDAIPVRFNQYTRSVYIFRREGFQLPAYRECLRIFALYPDAYYHTHSNYFDVLEDLGSLQASSYNSPVNIAYISDLVDTFYVAAMSGKFADRRAEVEVEAAALGAVEPEIRRAYDSFYRNPFLALGGACVHSILSRFYGVEIDAEPWGQSGKIVLGRVRELIHEAAAAIGPTSTSNHIRRFFNIASTYMNFSDVGLDLSPPSRNIRR
jgi:hypothetical protein